MAPAVRASCARIALRIADALFHAHGRGVIHRDVKPSNILLTSDGQAKLVDFGLARDAQMQTLTLTGEFAGTPSYVSPEQIGAGRIAIGHRTDVYSLGATLYEMLTLGHAFEGATTEEVFRKILVKEPEPVRRRNPLVPRDLEVITLKALEKDPERRYATAAAMASDLRCFLEFRPIAAKAAGPLSRSWRWARRNPMASVGAIATWAALCLAGILLWQNRAMRIAEARDLVAAARVDLAASRFGSAIEKLQGASSLAGATDEVRGLLARAQA